MKEVASNMLLLIISSTFVIQVAQRDREEKERIQNQFNIASGLFQSHAVFMAPGSGMLVRQSIKAAEEEDADDKAVATDKSNKTEVKCNLLNDNRNGEIGDVNST